MASDTDTQVASPLALRFAYFTECQLATMEYLDSLKSSSKYQRNRQRDIAMAMVQDCLRFRLDPSGNPRLVRVMESCTKPQEAEQSMFGESSLHLVKAQLSAEDMATWRRPVPFASRVAIMVRNNVTPEIIQRVTEEWEVWLGVERSL